MIHKLQKRISMWKTFVGDARITRTRSSIWHVREKLILSLLKFVLRALPFSSLLDGQNN